MYDKFDLPWWGYLKLAPHVYLLIYNYIPLEECQEILFPLASLCPATPASSSLRTEDEGNLITGLISKINYTNQDLQAKAVGKGKEIKKIRAILRIGPHNKDILSILFGSLLGDAHAEFRLKGKGTRINFYQEGSHVSYLIWLHKLISELGYCNTNLPKITTRLGKKGVVRKIIRFNT